MNHETESSTTSMSGDILPSHMVYQTAPVHATVDAFPSWALQPLLSSDQFFSPRLLLWSLCRQIEEASRPNGILGGKHSQPPAEGIGRS